MLLRLTGFLLAFCVSLEHGLHEGHALFAPRHLVGLLGLKGLTCSFLEGLTIAVIVMAVQGVVGLQGTAMGFATVAKLLTVTLLRDSTSRVSQTPCISGNPWLWIGLYHPLPFALSFWLCFSTMTRYMASGSSNNVQVDSVTIEWLWLYWFCHNIGTEDSTMAA
jgi:hypothetical protein